jgi:hypothetical protein
LICEICKKISGIGKVTAAAIGSDFEENLQEFLHAESDRFRQIKTTKGRQYLNEVQIDYLMIEKGYMASLSPREIWTSGFPASMT